MDTLVIDVETKKSFAEVGGEQNKRELGVSVAGIYSYAKDTFFALEEPELSKLGEMLKSTEHVIGFNINHFDIPVLEPYLGEGAFSRVAITDIYTDVTNFLGHRVGLDDLSKATLGKSKSGKGLEALEWFKQGRIEDIKKYCLNDVRLTRDLYEYGKKNGHILFESWVDGKIHSVPVHWDQTATPPPVLKIIEEAFINRKRLSLEYVSSENSDGLGFRKSRLVDIYKIKPNGEIEAFCHLRGGLRNFRLNRIVKAEITEDSYVIPEDFQNTLF